MSRRRILRRDACAELAASLPPALHPVLRRVYAARPMAGAHELDLGLERLLPVTSLGGVEQAVALLIERFESGGKVLVIGDFDADGATSTTLMMRLLQKHDEGEYKEGIGERVIEPGAPKQLTFESAFYVHGGSMPDFSAVREFLVSEANPVSAVVIGANPKGCLPSGAGRFINLDGKGFSLLTLKRAENGDGYVLRLMETAGRASNVRIVSGLLAIRSAELLDNVENPIRKLNVRNSSGSIQLRPREIVTLRLAGLSKREAHQ